MSKKEQKKNSEAEKAVLPEEETATEETVDTGEEERAEKDPIQEQLEAAEAKTAEYLAMAQRIQADFENYRRRNESVRADAFADGRKEVAAAMLPVLDNLERAVDASAACENEPLRNGVELVLRQLNEIYQKYQIHSILNMIYHHQV